MAGALMRYDASTGLSTPVEATTIAEPNYYRGTLSVDRVVNSGVDTYVDWTTVESSPGYSVQAFGGIMLPERGVYQISASSRWDKTNSINRRGIAIALNLTIMLRSDQPSANLPTLNSVNLTGALICEAGDVLYTYVSQTSGSQVSMLADSLRSWITVARIGPNEGYLGDWFGLP